MGGLPDPVALGGTKGDSRRGSGEGGLFALLSNLEGTWLPILGPISIGSGSGEAEGLLVPGGLNTPSS